MGVTLDRKSQPNPVLFTCFVHKKTSEKYNKEQEKKFKNVNICLKSRMDSGPWRFNSLYGFVEIRYDWSNRITGERFINYRNREGFWYHKPGTFVHWPEYSQTCINSGGPCEIYSNKLIIRAIKDIIQQEEAFFRRKRKYLEYNMEIIENTNWSPILNKLKQWYDERNKTVK